MTSLTSAGATLRSAWGNHDEPHHLCVGKADGSRSVVLARVHALYAAAKRFGDGRRPVEPQRDHGCGEHVYLVARELRCREVRDKQEHDERHPAKDRSVEVEHGAQRLERQHLAYGDEGAERKGEQKRCRRDLRGHGEPAHEHRDIGFQQLKFHTAPGSITRYSEATVEVPAAEMSSPHLKAAPTYFSMYLSMVPSSSMSPMQASSWGTKAAPFAAIRRYTPT